jgi:hypothetical protein
MKSVRSIVSDNLLHKNRAVCDAYVLCEDVVKWPNRHASALDANVLGVLLVEPVLAMHAQ